MTDELPPIRMIPVDAITILNPRVRNKRIFNELVTSIAHLGLKKPITVSRRAGNDGYDLVCGQGRLEAFIALHQKEIPAVVIEATEEDCYVMSLVENLARRNHSSLELMREIYALKERGYSTSEIAAKTDFSTAYVEAICDLFQHGEERLIAAVERGVLPPTVAIEIAKAKDSEVQAALADAYEKKAIPGNQVQAIRRIIEQRNAFGKGIHSVSGQVSRMGKRVTAEMLVRTYREETERQKLLVKKATLTQSRLLFVVNALRRLLADEHFVTLLRAEAMQTMPRLLAERIGSAGV
jgi:ParB family chromosome partitioning protein